MNDPGTVACNAKDTQEEDVEIGRCLENVKVHPVDTRL